MGQGQIKLYLGGVVKSTLSVLAVIIVLSRNTIVVSVSVVSVLASNTTRVTCPCNRATAATNNSTACCSNDHLGKKLEG